jgi:hypothetical protein
VNIQACDKLPTVKEVVAEVAVNPNTVMKAYWQLDQLLESGCVFQIRLEPVKRRDGIHAVDLSAGPQCVDLAQVVRPAEPAHTVNGCHDGLVAFAYLGHLLDLAHRVGQL